MIPHGSNTPAQIAGIRLAWRVVFSTEGNSEAFCARGWSYPERGFRWSLGGISTLRLPARAPMHHYVLVVRGHPFLSPPHIVHQRISVFLDGEQVGFLYSSTDSVYSFHLSPCARVRESSLTFQYLDVASPSDFGASDTRRLAFAWHSVELIEVVSELVEYLIAYGSGLNGKATNSDTLITLAGWALREMGPWLIPRVNDAHIKATLRDLNATRHWSALYQAREGKVALLPKPKGVPVDRVPFDRAKVYEKFFRKISARLPRCFSTNFCLVSADQIIGAFNVPIFAFQRMSGESTILLPDIEFLQYDFYEAPDFQDNISFQEKRPTAVFAGSTTGVPLITMEYAQSLSVPRLQAAAFFENSLRVDFRLPSIVQCESLQVRNILRQHSFCQRPNLSWSEQFQHRFLISIDGNGATCSRMAIALLSNSVLVKYDSPHLLYYFDALRQDVHYAPVSTHTDVNMYLDSAYSDPGRFKQIAQKGKEFGRSYLTRQRAEEYTAMLFILYEHCVKLGDKSI